MKKYLLTYKTTVLEFISSRLNDADVSEITVFLAELEKKIDYFQHERLIHLLVTLAFAILEIIAIVSLCTYYTLVSLVLSIMFLILLVPYVFHYYFLENNVQEFYKLRDKIVAVKNSKS